MTGVILGQRRELVKVSPPESEGLVCLKAPRERPFLDPPPSLSVFSSPLFVYVVSGSTSPENQSRV